MKKDGSPNTEGHRIRETTKSTYSRAIRKRQQRVSHRRRCSVQGQLQVQLNVVNGPVSHSPNGPGLTAVAVGPRGNAHQQT